MLVVGADPALRAARIRDERRQGGIGLDPRDEVERRVLPPVDLAGVESRARGGGIRNVAPHDTIDVDDLAARRSARLLLAGDVIGVLHVDNLVAGLPLVLAELERS